MAGLVAGEGADQAVSQQIEIANGVEDLMPDELIAIAQPVLVQYAVVVDDHGVVQAAAQRQLLALHPLDITQKPERAGATDLLNKGGGGKVDLGVLIQGLEQRMVEIDGEGYLEAVIRLEATPLVAFLHPDRLFDADEALERVLLFDAGGTDQKHERPGAAVHDRHFGRADVDVAVVDAEAGQGREQMLYGRYPHAVLD